MPDKKAMDTEDFLRKAKWHKDRIGTLGNANMAESYANSARLHSQFKLQKDKEEGKLGKSGNWFAFRS